MATRASLLALLAAFATPAAATERTEVPVFRQVAGEIRRVLVEPGESLIRLAARHGVRWQTLADANGIGDPERLRAGQELGVDTRRIVPSLLDEGVVVNIPEATLYVFEAGTLTARYPVGLGRAGRQTPVGSFTVLFSQSDPTWDAPSSVQEEAEREGRVVTQKVAPGPDSSLGKYWIQLSGWGYGIHGTPFRSTIGQFLGHGCVRLADQAMEDLYRRVRKGTRAELAYTPVKLAVIPNGEIWVEAHPDIYGRGTPGEKGVLAAREREGAAEGVDREALRAVLAGQRGLAQKVGSAARGPSPVSGAPEVSETESAGAALWRCLDCPPGLNRRVTLQVEARRNLDLPNPFPIEIRDDAGRVVFRPQMVAQALVHLGPGETRNFVWEVRDTEGQPLPPGSYTAVIRFFAGGEGGAQKQTLSLPLWLGN